VGQLIRLVNQETRVSLAKRPSHSGNHQVGPNHDLLRQPTYDAEAKIPQDLLALLLFGVGILVCVLHCAVAFADQAVLRPQTIGEEGALGSLDRTLKGGGWQTREQKVSGG
jgi:hypothetical protein